MQPTSWIADYLRAQKAALDSIPVETVARLIARLTTALKEDRQIFTFGNGGSAANTSHFATDLGKSASDRVRRRFRVLTLNDNVPWITAIANDYAYEDIFVRQMENYAQPGDVALCASVSGDSPNCVKALAWAREHGLHTIALVGGRRGRCAELADECVMIADTHYGRVEDAQMGVLHLLCYAFIEHPEWAE